MIRSRRRRYHRKIQPRISRDDGATWRTAPSDFPDGRLRELQAILLGHLQAADFPGWPGADGLTLNDAVSTYPQASALGLVPGLAELRDRHPELAEMLPQLFSIKSRN